jgi:PcRGLX-like protein C-terminal alpha/alpha toroid domain/PcRGLX-like protein central beta sandwich domain/PcRGLX-like N-terminal RIFT barrel domain
MRKQKRAWVVILAGLIANVSGCGGDEGASDSTTSPDGSVGDAGTEADVSSDGISDALHDQGDFDGEGDATTPPAGELLVNLHVEEPSGVVRASAPVRTGVPFPKGLLGVDAPIGLFAGQQALPVQSRALSLWDDGTVRWLLMDTQLDLAAGEDKAVELRRVSAPPTVADPLEITEAQDSITVDTGAVRIEIPKQYGGVINRAWVAGQLVIDAPSDPTDRGPWVTRGGTQFHGGLLQSSSSPLGADPIDLYRQYVANHGLAGGFNLYDPWDLSVIVEEQGPLHAVVRVAGTHLDDTGMGFCTSIVRLHAYRGLPTLRLDHTLVYTGHAGAPINGYGMRIPFAGGRTVIEGHELAEGSVAHLAPDSHEITGQGTQSGHARGFVGRDDSSVGVSITLRDMAENFPKALVATPTALEAQLYPTQAAPLDLSRYSNTIDTANGETSGPDNRAAQGLSKTESMLLRFHSGSVDTATLESDADAFDQGELLLLAEQPWYSEAAVMGVGPFYFDPAPSSEVHYRTNGVLHVLADFMRYNQRVQFGWYGLLDYGDIRGRFNGGGSGFTWHELGRYGWSGNSGEPSNQLWTQFLRRSSRQSFLDAEALARHTLDVQMVHFGDSDSVGASDWSGHNREFAVGSLHRHGRQAFSGYAGLPEYSHVAGVETYYYLTGDTRAKEALYEAAQFMMRYGVNNPDYTATVNGLDVLSRAAAVFHDDAATSSRFNARVDVLLSYLSAGSPNPVQQELQGADVGSAFGFFVRGAPGLLYHHERTGDTATAERILDAADVLVAGADGDAWGLGESGDAGGVFYFLNTLTYAAHIAADHGRDPDPYFQLAQRVLEWNCHAAESPGTGAISLDSLQAIPSDWRDWTWTWDDEPLDPAAPGILWIDRQLTFRNDYMQDYHSYRAFIHLAAAAAMLEPGQGTPR